MRYHIKGSVDSEILSEPGFDDLSMDIEGYENYYLDTSGLAIDSELRIDREGYLVRRLMMEGRDAADSEKTDSTLKIIMEFLDFNKPVTFTEL